MKFECTGCGCKSEGETLLHADALDCVAWLASRCRDLIGRLERIADMDASEAEMNAADVAKQALAELEEP